MALTGSGVIFAIVVVAWLCYLVPLTLRRHEEAVRSRSVDRFSTAMRVLGRTDDAGSTGATPTPPKPRSAAVPARRPGSTNGSTAGVGASTAGPMPGRSAVRGGAQSPPPAVATRRAARVAAARRRRVLIVLLLVTVAVTAAAVARWLPLWSPAVPVVAVVGFLVLARWQVTRARTAAWEQSLRASATPTSSARSPVAGSAATRSAATGSTATGPAATGPAAPGHPAARTVLAPEPAVTREPAVSPEPAVVPEPAAPAPEPVAATPGAPTEQPSSLWDPVPVTLPTYVSKPRAEPGIRTIDLTGSEARTSGRPAGGQPSAAGRLPDSGRTSELPSGSAVTAPEAVVRPAVGD